MKKWVTVTAFLLFSNHDIRSLSQGATAHATTLTSLFIAFSLGMGIGLTGNLNTDPKYPTPGVGNYFFLGATLRRPRLAEGRTFLWE